jgi:tRNA dimethylallyltransferase
MKLITLLGQTSSGKTKTSLDMYNYITSSGGECVLVNCDSRQIYQYLNIGTGKIEGVWKPYQNNHQAYYHTTAPHFMIDYVDPSVRFSMADYLQDWCQLFTHELASFNGTVIVVGGTGLWAKALFEEYQPGIIKPEFQDNYEVLKTNLNKLDLIQLQEQNNREDFNNSDWYNTRRLINRVLRNTATSNGWTEELTYPSFDSKELKAIEIHQDVLQKNITSRLNQRIQQGLFEEVASLMHLDTRLLELGLEYRLTYLYIKGKMSKQEWKGRLLRENIAYAKRQLSWLKKQPVTWM